MMRVDIIFDEEMEGDSSFTEKESGLSRLFGKSYNSSDMRDTWRLGVKHGIEIGLRRASLEGQIIELTNNVKNKRQEEFLRKFFELAEKYNCAIKYHVSEGMVIMDLQDNFNPNHFKNKV